MVSIQGKASPTKGATHMKRLTLGYLIRLQAAAYGLTPSERMDLDLMLRLEREGRASWQNHERED